MGGSKWVTTTTTKNRKILLKQIKGGLESNVKHHKLQSEACTHRPSLPIGISRNRVSVTEVALKSIA